ncbi:hypothetical protein [Mesorhizobium sp. BR1-1-14]|uniref:hypothetical protein n=1 Tax=Mesorhizobium sp. BR1-1-14 TaxID=2876655 RepID=UPI000DD98CA4|nr:hypothetical protein [Mesorhizobium sp. BR1-1-14]MBZ9959016.1 hypothetical protein [Mesorhizobium sp. BR1-1-14]
MADHLTSLIDLHGPSRSSRLAELLISEHGLTAEAARKRLSRSKPPIHSFPIPLLPKQEAFVYHVKDRQTERFWQNFHRDLRETESVYGAAIDGLSARGGVVSVDEFSVISGAPILQKKQVAAVKVAQRLQDAGMTHTIDIQNYGSVIALRIPTLNSRGNVMYDVRQMAEGVLLDGIREWARRLGIASYNSIAIRGDDHPRTVGPYKWDLTGPSYLLPLKKSNAGKDQQGFTVADVFVGTVLNEYQIRYFIRKARGLLATRIGSILPIIVADGFTGEAYTLGHRNGLLMATPESLFGSHAGSAFTSLVETLQNAAAIVSKNPSRLVTLLSSLKDIAGRAGNLRGVLFELVCAYLIRNDGNSIDLGKKAYDPKVGKFYDIDIMCVRGKAECVLYECKAGEPGHVVTRAEVEEWLRRIPTFVEYVRANTFLREAEIRCEIWTSGEFDADALVMLASEKARRTNIRIDWKNGKAVRAAGTGLKEKTITDAIDQHFFKHPLSN